MPLYNVVLAGEIHLDLNHAHLMRFVLVDSACVRPTNDQLSAEVAAVSLFPWSQFQRNQNSTDMG